MPFFLHLPTKSVPSLPLILPEAWKHFAAMMNERAAALGCTNTHFTNPNGLPDPNHYTSSTRHGPDYAGMQSKTKPFCRVESDLSYTIPPTNMTASPRPIFRTTTYMLFQDGS